MAFIAYIVPMNAPRFAVLFLVAYSALHEFIGFEILQRSLAYQAFFFHLSDVSCWIRAANIEKISLPALVLRGFIIHQPLVIILRLLDAEIAGHGVHGDEWLVEPFVQAGNRLTQGIVFLNNDHWGL